MPEIDIRSKLRPLLDESTPLLKGVGRHSTALLRFDLSDLFPVTTFAVKSTGQSGCDQFSCQIDFSLRHFDRSKCLFPQRCDRPGPVPPFMHIFPEKNVQERGNRIRPVASCWEQTHSTGQSGTRKSQFDRKIGHSHCLG